MDYSKLESKYGLPKGLLGAVASVETGGEKDPDKAISHRGAIGRLQLMPKTAKELGVNPYIPEQNVEGGAKYLKWLLDRFDNDTQKAVTAYNYGIGNLRKAEKNARLTGDHWTNFIKTDEARNYYGKVAANLGVNEIEQIQPSATKVLDDTLIGLEGGKNLKKWTFDQVQQAGWSNA